MDPWTPCTSIRMDVETRCSSAQISKFLLLGSAEPTDLKCVIWGLKMTYIAGLGSAEPSLIKTANLHPYFTTCKNHPSPLFSLKRQGALWAS